MSSALPPNSDVARRSRHFAFVLPKGDTRKQSERSWNWDYPLLGRDVNALEALRVNGFLHGAREDGSV
jgi:hypothetical protein